MRRQRLLTKTGKTKQQIEVRPATPKPGDGNADEAVEVVTLAAVAKLHNPCRGRQE